MEPAVIYPTLPKLVVQPNFVFMSQSFIPMSASAGES